MSSLDKSTSPGCAGKAFELGARRHARILSSGGLSLQVRGLPSQKPDYSEGVATLGRPAPVSRPIAFCSDVQGNLPALEAVLADLARRAITDIYVVGNIVLGSDKPLEVWMRLANLQAHLTQGPKDLATATVDPTLLKPKDAREKAVAAAFKQTRDALGEFVLQKLKRLPLQLRMPLIQGDELVALHGSPADPTTEFSHDLDDDEVMALVGDDPADLIVCGGALVPFDRIVAGVRIVNVGVVHSEKSRVAHYSVITPKLDGIVVEQSWTEY